MAKSDEAKAEKPSPWDKLDVPIQYQGRAITLPGEPEEMPLVKAIEALQRKQKDEEQEFQVMEQFDAYPHDAAVCVVRAMTKLYGWVSPESQRTWFGPKPPQMMTIKTGPGVDDVVQCPIGQFKLPGVDAPVTTMMHPEMGFIIHGVIKKKHRHVVLELTTEARRILAKESIYRGKPIKIGVDEEGFVNKMNAPEFLDVSDIREGDVLFDDEIKAQVDTNVLVPIRETERCKELGIPLKRGVLLEGPFGTGKTLLARLVAHEAEANGWTFVLLERAQGLRAALEFANRYAPAVVFAEDIDRIMEVRDEKANDLVNTIDGVVSKNSQIMVILTTNHVEKIAKVMLRPGRLDAVLSLRAPNAPTVERLIRHYARDLIADGEDLTTAGKELSGQIPATIRECVERAKLGMVGRRANQLIAKDLVTAAQSMKAHWDLMKPPEEKLSTGDKLAGALKEVVANGNAQEITLREVNKKVDIVIENVS